MRFKKRLFLFASVVLISVYFGLYFFSYNNGEKKSHEPFEKYRAAKYVQIQKLSKSIKNDNGTLHKKAQLTLKYSCDAPGSTSQSDIQMLNLYKEMRFDNVDGGVWKQGWNIQINKSRWNSNNKLKVFVVPHSHNDPGWKKTFENYYASQTRHIFNNMVTKLSVDTRRKFIWAEVSYLSLWWAEASDIQKEEFIKLLENGQIEIVSGGWVMPDEANSHYYSIIQQLTHGHQWLWKHLKYKPKRSWCIDPFGESPTMPFLLQHFGLESLVIQRTHYSVKKYLAKNKQLEFRWRQLWDKSGRFDFMTHMMPFYIYDIPHTCGPDPAVCCQFDFRRSVSVGMICPWKKQPQLINDRNIAQRANMLLDQYRKKAELYSTNVLLVPLGDDFRYDDEREWDLQYQNYRKLFEYMNNNPLWFVEAQFGTLHDYFEALKQEKLPDQFPSLSGDFFTYSDRDDHYWSGYYTSRPYYKRMDRELISYLRGAELLHALAWKSTSLEHSKWLLSDTSGFVASMQSARANLSLFQHHDGITGTAKDHVMDDYAQKLHRAMAGAQHVMQQSLNFLLNSDKASYQAAPELIYLDLVKSKKIPSDDDKLEALSVSESAPTKRIVIFNSLTWKRTEIVSVKIETYKNIELRDEKDNLVPYQISPFCDLKKHDGHCFLLYFEVNIKPLSVVTFFLYYDQDLTNRNNLASVSILNIERGSEINYQIAEDFPKYEHPIGSDFSIQNSRIAVSFRPDGLMKAITLRKPEFTVSVHLNFVRYTCKHAKEMCGAYLFLPDGDGREVNCQNPLIKIMEGKLVSSVITYCDFVIHAVNIYNVPGSEENSIEIQNLVDIKTEHNFEIAMKVSTNIMNGGTFFTDLNGFQVIKRQYLSKLPLQANYYPMPTSIYIEDESTRLTVVSAQPLGASSLSQGSIEIMQDRRLDQDDNLGLGQGVMDNRPVLHVFRLALEKRIVRCQKTPDTHAAGYLSMIPYLALNTILYPLTLFIQQNTETNQDKLSTSYSFTGIQDVASIDVHIVSVNTIKEEQSVGIILHRTDLDTCWDQEYENYVFSNILVNISSFIPVRKNDVVHESSTSFIQLKSRLNESTLYSLCPMDLAAFYVKSTI